MISDNALTWLDESQFGQQMKLKLYSLTMHVLIDFSEVDFPQNI